MTREQYRQKYGQDPPVSLVHAEQGNAEAQFDLGFMYANGKGVPQDYAEAAKCYRKAADQGRPLAQFNLGNLYVDGRGVPKNYVEAYVLFSLAASASTRTESDVAFSLPVSASDLSQAAIVNRDMTGEKMTPEDIAKAQRRSSELVPRPSVQRP